MQRTVDDEFEVVTSKPFNTSLQVDLSIAPSFIHRVPTVQCNITETRCLVLLEHAGNTT